MSECPQCHSSIEVSDANFGTLFNCPNCQAVFFIGWDGIPEQPQSQSQPGEAQSFAPQASPAWEPSPEQEIPQPVSAVPDFKDIVDFGNAPNLKSALTYTVTIQGIEIADIREKFREAISDARFNWDVGVILKQIQAGVIVFPDLSPAKATALINRIKYLPIRISWRQNVLS